MNFTTDKINVFKNVFKSKGGDNITKYSTTLSRKNQQGNYENIFCDIRFNLKDSSKKARVERFEEGVTYIMKAEGFVTFDMYANKLKETITKVVFVINDFTPIDKKEKTKVEKAKEDLPF